jgi:hypothetical protein
VLLPLARLDAAPPPSPICIAGPPSTTISAPIGMSVFFA